jgi:hypothetical protein
LPGALERALTRRRLRRRRAALVQELGALAYELQRQGRHAPELLEEKAAKLSALDAELEPLGGDAEAGRDKSLLPALAALLALVVVGAGASGFALSELTSNDDDHDDEVSAADSARQPPPAAGGGEPQRPTRGGESEQPTAPTETTAGAPQRPRRSLLLDWPEDLTAYTVVLVSSGDGPAARRVAREAARSGLEAGLLRSDDYNLGTGLWIVFAGRFDTRAGAVRQASDLAERYPGAYPQRVEPAP